MQKRNPELIYESSLDIMHQRWMQSEMSQGLWELGLLAVAPVQSEPKYCNGSLLIKLLL